MITVNPISGKVWNEVIRRDRVNLTRKLFRLHKYPKQPQSDHNLFPAIYSDIYLAAVWRYVLLFNPISGKVWNDVIRRDRVNLTRKYFWLHKYPKQPQSDHNLFPVVYFDICLAIGIKITLKWSRFLMKLAIVWKYSKLIFFKPKHMKTSNLWLQMSYIPKKSWEYAQ